MTTSGALFAIGGGEFAAAQDANALRFEIISGDFGDPGKVEASASGRHITLRSKSSEVLYAGGRQQRSDADGLDAGELFKPGAHGEVEGVDGGLRRILLARQVIAGSEHVPGVEAQVHITHLFKAAQQQPEAVTSARATASSAMTRAERSRP